MSTRRQQTLYQQNRNNNAQNNNETHLISHELKQMGTIDIRFDKRSRESIVKQDAVDKYQENCYMLGRIFSNYPLSEQTCASNADEILKEASQDLVTKDIQQVISELPEGELRNLLQENLKTLKDVRNGNHEDLNETMSEHDVYMSLINKVKTQNYQLNELEMQAFVMHPVIGENNEMEFDLDTPDLKLIQM